MKYIHPRRFARNMLVLVQNPYNIFKLKLQARKFGVRLTVGENVRLRNCILYAKRCDVGNELVIADDCDLNGAIFIFYNGRGIIHICEGVKINARKGAGVSIKTGVNTSINVGEGCLFSNSIDICTTDFHPIYNEDGNRINEDRSIVIGAHSWIGRHAYIGKGVKLAENTIVGAYSVVTKQFEEKNVVVAGNPAKIKKRNIYWQA